jgi:hypothetical protein
LDCDSSDARRCQSIIEKSGYEPSLIRNVYCDGKISVLIFDKKGESHLTVKKVEI